METEAAAPTPVPEMLSMEAMGVDLAHDTHQARAEAVATFMQELGVAREALEVCFEDRSDARQGRCCSMLQWSEDADAHARIVCSMLGRTAHPSAQAADAMEGGRGRVQGGERAGAGMKWQIEMREGGVRSFVIYEAEKAAEMSEALRETVGTGEEEALEVEAAGAAGHVEKGEIVKLLVRQGLGKRLPRASRGTERMAHLRRVQAGLCASIGQHCRFEVVELRKPVLMAVDGELSRSMDCALLTLALDPREGGMFIPVAPPPAGSSERAVGVHLRTETTDARGRWHDRVLSVDGSRRAEVQWLGMHRCIDGLRPNHDICARRIKEKVKIVGASAVEVSQLADAVCEMTGGDPTQVRRMRERSGHTVCGLSTRPVHAT